MPYQQKACNAKCAISSPKNLFEAPVELFCDGADVFGDFCGRLRRFIVIEIAREGDFVANLRFLFIDPGVWREREDFALHVGVNAFCERDVLRVAARGIGLELAALADGLAVFTEQRALDGDFLIAERLIRENLAVFRFAEVAVDAADFFDLFFGDFDALAAERFSHLRVDAVRVDELHLATPLGRLAIREHPDVRRDARVVKDVIRQGDDGFDEVVLEQVAADFRRAAACVAREERRAVVDDGNATAGLFHLADGGFEEEHLAVADGGHARAKASGEAFRLLVRHDFLLILPLASERRIAEDVVKRVACELVVRERVAGADVRGVFSFDERVRLADGERLVVDFLPVGNERRGGVELFEVFARDGEHAASSAGGVVERLDGVGRG